MEPVSDVPIPAGADEAPEGVLAVGEDGAGPEPALVDVRLGAGLAAEAVVAVTLCREPAGPETPPVNAIRIALV